MTTVETELRELWTESGVSPERQEEIIEQVTESAQNPPTFGEEDNPFVVDPKRLAWGDWNHQSQTTDGEGDISAAYSADVIGDGRIRKPFKFMGSLWCCASKRGTGRDGHACEATAYQLVPRALFAGKFGLKQEPGNWYHSMKVKHGGVEYVLSGPSKTFVPGDGASFAAETVQASMFGESDPEYSTRIEAARATAQFRVKVTPRVPQNAIEDLPLWGGERQGGLFE